MTLTTSVWIGIGASGMIFGAGGRTTWSSMARTRCSSVERVAQLGRAEAIAERRQQLGRRSAAASRSSSITAVEQSSNANTAALGTM